MGGVRRIALCGLAAIALAAAPVAAQSRSFGTRLTGDELLVEFEKVAPGPEAPGIYAVGKDGSLSRVITYGRFPRWAPSRTRFAFQLGPATCVAELGAGRYNPVGKHLGFQSPTGQLPSFLVPHMIEWLPDERELVRWVSWGNPFREDRQLASDGGQQPVFLIPGDEDFQLHPLVGGDRFRSVGRLSFSPDGGYIAYEVFTLLMDRGVRDRELWVFNRETETRQRLELPLGEGVELANPKWSPDGRRIALDCDVPNGERFSVVVDWPSRDMARLDSVFEGTDWTQVVEWAPDSAHLLIAHGPGRGTKDTWISVVAVPHSGAPKALFTVGRGNSYQACWSPDGQQVAALEGQVHFIATPTASAPLLAISRFGDRDRQWITYPEYLRPVSMDW